MVAPGGQQAGEDDEHDVHGGARGGDGFRRRRPRWPEKLAEGSPET